MQPKTLTLALALLLSCGCAHAEDMNPETRLTALIHTERAKRDKKFFCLVPGKIIKWHYELVMKDGTTKTKTFDKEIKGVYDRRPLRESHPNSAIVLPILNSVGSAASPLIAKTI